VTTSDSDPGGEKLLRLLRDNQVDLNVAEGLRLVIAFDRISAPTDRRTLIELAERSAKQPPAHGHRIDCCSYRDLAAGSDQVGGPLNAGEVADDLDDRELV
jgi:hypothetical protein